MKKIYSVILLFSFLTGALQPVMPMIEYQLYTGSLVEFFGFEKGNSEKPCDHFLQLVKEDCENQQNNSQQSLLDDDYYPLAVQITTPPKPIAFPNKKKLEILIVQNIAEPSFSPNPPPPRLS